MKLPFVCVPIGLGLAYWPPRPSVDLSDLANRQLGYAITCRVHSIARDVTTELTGPFHATRRPDRMIQILQQHMRNETLAWRRQR